MNKMSKELQYWIDSLRYMDRRDWHLFNAILQYNETVDEIDRIDAQWDSFRHTFKITKSI